VFIFFQCQVSQHRIEIDRISAAAEGIVTVKVDMLPSGRRDCLGKDECFGVFARLVFVEQPRKDGGGCKELLGYRLSVRKISKVLGLGYTNHVALNTYINKRGLHQPVKA